MRAWERGERQDLGLRVIHQRAELGESGDELLTGLVPGGVGVGGLGLGEDRAERGSDVVGLGLGDVGEQVAGVVDPAALVRHALEAAPQRLDESRVLVRDHQLHSAQPTLLQSNSQDLWMGMSCDLLIVS